MLQVKVKHLIETILVIVTCLPQTTPLILNCKPESSREISGQAFSSTPGMNQPLYVTINVIFTRLKHLKYLLASDPGVRSESHRESDTN